MQEQAIDEAFINGFKKLLKVTNVYLETFYNYIDIELPELATITLQNLGRDLPKHIKETENLPEPGDENLKKLKQSYINWLKAQLESCRLLNEYKASPDDDRLRRWQESFRQAELLQEKTGRLIMSEKMLKERKGNRYE